jgi:hypothetical protein
VFALYSPSHTLSPSLPPSHSYQLPGRNCYALMFPDFVTGREKKMTLWFV